MKYSRSVRNLTSQPVIIVMSDDVHGIRYQSIAESSLSEKLFYEAKNLMKNENNTLYDADLIVAITDKDAENMKRYYNIPEEKIILWRFTYNTPTSSTSNIHSPVKPFSERNDLVFVGGPNQCNTDSIMWFGEKVLPIINEMMGTPIQLKVAGFVQLPKDWLKEHPYVKRLGLVPEIESLLAESKVFISPIIYGTGINTKNILALSNSIPLVTTSFGSNAFLRNSQGEFDYMGVSDDPHEFAKLVLDRYTSESSWNKYSSAGLNYVTNNHGLTALREDTIRCLDKVNRIRMNYISTFSESESQAQTQLQMKPSSPISLKLNYAYAVFLVTMIN